MFDGLSGLIAIGAVATVGFMMVRSFSARRDRTGASSDSSTTYWPSSDYSSNPSRDTDRSDSGGSWFGSLFSSSDSSSSSHDSGGSSDFSSSDSSSSDSGGGDSGGGGGSD